MTVDSELQIPELLPGGGVPDVWIRLSDGSPSPRKATIDEEFASTTDLADFVIRGGREILVYPRSGADMALLRVVLLGKVMAFLLRQRGWLPLHASGVRVGGAGVLFIGPSGLGKSTTAAAFHARGHQVIADDVGPVRVLDGKCMMQPSGVRLRLMDDARVVFGGKSYPMEFQVDKHSVDVRSAGSELLLPLGRIYLLEYGSDVSSEPIAPLPATALLDRNSFIKRWRVENEVIAWHLKACAEVASHVPVCRLTRQRSLQHLPELVSFVEKDLESHG